MPEGLLSRLIKDEEFLSLSSDAKKVAIRKVGAQDDDYKSLPVEARNIVEARIINETSPSFLSRAGSAALTGLRAIDVPRQALLAHAGGFPLSRSIEQVTDPEKTISGAEVIEKQFAGSEIAAPTTPLGLAGRVGLESVLEFADPLILAGAFKTGARVVGAKAGAKTGRQFGGETAKLAKQAETGGVKIRPSSAEELQKLGGAESQPRFVPKPLMTAGEADLTESLVTRRLPNEMKGIRLSTETSKAVVDAAESVIKQSGKIPDPDLPVTLQVVKALEDSPQSFSALGDALRERGLSLVDFGQAFIATESSAGRQLQQLSALSKRLKTLAPELSDAIEGAREPLSAWDLAGHFSKRFSNLWRASLVTAWSTAVRNAGTQAARFGLDQVEGLMNVAVNNVFRLGGKPERALGPEFQKIFETFGSLGSRGKRKAAREILNAFPDESNRLFSHFASDIAVTSAIEGGKLGRGAQGIEKVFNAAEKGINFFNTFNRAQEFLIRTSVFRGELSRLLRQQGKNLLDLAPNQIDPELISKSVTKALDTTFALTPDKGPFRSIFKFLDRFPKLIVPFPRFMVNALKFQFDFSPAGFLKLLSQSERARIAAGDSKTINKAIIGSSLLYSAMEIRSDPTLAGEKWWEIKSGDRRVDMRPFAPFANYLFFAEVLKRGTQGQNIGDVIQGVGASQFRAGAGLFMLEQVQNLITGLADADTDTIERASRAFRRFGGEVLGGFLQPITTFRELFIDYGEFLGAGKQAAEEGKLREVRGDPFTGPIRRRIPFVSQGLPEKELPLRADTPRQETVEPGGVKLSRQLTGLSIQTRNAIEAESNRLGLTFGEILARTGDPDADRLVQKEMGPISENVLSKVLKSEKYLALSDAGRRLVFTQVINDIKRTALERAAVKNPKLFKPILLKRNLPRRVREVLKERSVPGF